MKLSATLFLFLIHFATFGQVNINDLDRVEGVWMTKGTTIPFTGKFAEYFENGKIKGKGEFKNGVVDGSRITYYENGKVKREVLYTAGVLNGPDKEYFENGMTKQEGVFRSGKLEGTSKVYYDNGNLQAIINFSGGIQQGDYFEYSPDGKLVVQYFYTNGKAGYGTEFNELTKQALELSRQSKNEEAVKVYDKAIILNPTVAQAYFNRGACKAFTFDFEGAIKDYDKAIEIKPDYTEAYANRGSAKINIFTSKGNLQPTAEQVKSACEDFHKAESLGGEASGVGDMIYVYCNKKE